MNLDRFAPYWLVFPGLALGLAVILYPTYEVFEMSGSAVSRFGKVGSFNQWANFHAVFADPLFWLSLRNTLLWTVGVVLGTVLVSVPVALILNAEFHGRALARVLVSRKARKYR